MDKKLLRNVLKEEDEGGLFPGPKKDEPKKAAPSEPSEDADTGNEMIEGLVKHFGEEFREEIQDSFVEKEDYGYFTCDGQDYQWIIDFDTANEMAVDNVKGMLEDDPDSFTKDWIQKYLTISDTDKRIIAQEEADNLVDEVWDDDQNLDEAGLTKEYEDAEEDDKEAILDRAKDHNREAKSSEIEDALEDPIGYFVDEQGTYTINELMKASFISIDTMEAATDAVQVDGWEHFLSHSSGSYIELDNGVVVFEE